MMELPGCRLKEFRSLGISATLRDPWNAPPSTMTERFTAAVLRIRQKRNSPSTTTMMTLTSRLLLLPPRHSRLFASVISGRTAPELPMNLSFSVIRLCLALLTVLCSLRFPADRHLMLPGRMPMWLNRHRPLNKKENNMSYLDQIKGQKFKVSKVTVDGVDFYLVNFQGSRVSTLKARRIYSFVFLR